MMNPINKMGVRIGELRRERGLTQEKLASALGISPQAVSKWETGLGLPDIALLPQLAQVLGTTLSDLFGVEEPAAAAIVPEQAVVPATVAPEVSVVPAAEPENAYFPPEKDGLELVSVWRDRACYARKAPKGVQGKLCTWVEGARVKFEDGSTADLATGEVVNYGGQEIVIDYNDEWEPRRGPECAACDAERAWSFDAIHSLDVRLGGNANCTIYKGTDGVCQVTADGAEELLAGLEVRETSGMLVVELKQVQTHKGFWGHWRGKGQQVSIEIHTGFEQGKSCKLTISGSGSIECRPDFDESTAQISGSGDLSMQGAGALNARIAGSGDLDFYSARDAVLFIAGSGDISGKLVAGGLKCSVAGSGDVDVEQVVADTAEVSVAGSGDIGLRHLDAQSTSVSVSGSGDIALGEGSGGSLSLDMGGTGNMDAAGCTFSDAVIRMGGMSEATIGHIMGASREIVAKGSVLRVNRRG